MNCPKCGMPNSESAVKCGNCGQELQPAGGPPQAPPMPEQAAGPGPPSTPPSMPAQPVEQVPNYMVWSILVTIFCCLPTGIVAIVYSSKVSGKLAAGDVAEARRLSRNARTWCIVSLVAVVLWAIIGILAAIAIPQFVTYRQRSFDAMARSQLKNLATAQEVYFAANNRYAATMRELGSKFKPNPKVSVYITFADNRRWTAEARHVQSRNTWRYDSSRGGLLPPPDRRY